MDAVLFLHAGADDVVAFTQAPVGIDEVLGHDEDGNALGPRGIALDAGQDGVDDVIDQVVLAVGDEDFVACQVEGAVGVAHGRGGQAAHVGAGLRLGEQHGAAPAAGVDLFEIGSLLFLRAVELDHMGRAGSHRAVGAERPVGPHEIFFHGGADRMRQTLAAVFRRRRGGGPLAFEVESVHAVKALRHFDAAVTFVANADAVAVRVGRQHLLEGEAPGFAHDQVEGLAIEGIELLGGGQLLHFEQFMQNEIDVPPVGY